MKKTSFTPRCYRSELEAIAEAYELEHGEGTFHGSQAWLATAQPGWHNGVCERPADHVGGCVFSESAASERRKAS